MSLQPHQERVIAEKDELVDRIEKLRGFVASRFFNESVEPAEQVRLTRQLRVMREYLAVLVERIEAFE